jgi:hypothetical protein
MTDLGSSEGSTWSVLLLNDDYTPMDFVVDVIERFFDMDRESARHLMLRVHNEGTAECGIYPYEMAKQRRRRWWTLPANIGIRLNALSSASGRFVDNRMLRQLTLADMDEAATVHRRSFDHALPTLAGLHTPAEDRWFF